MSSLGCSQTIEDLSIQSPLSDKSTESTPNIFNFQQNQLVWAKVSGFRFWPGLIVDSGTNSSVPNLHKLPFKEGWELVQFFGTYDFAWVSPKSCIVSYADGLKKGLPNKCKGKAFKIAVDEAKNYSIKGVKPEAFDAIPEIIQSDSDSEIPHTESILSPLAYIAESGNKPETNRILPESPENRDNYNPYKKKKLDTGQVEDIVGSSSSLPGVVPLTEGRVRCITALRKLGLIAPEEYLGRKFPKKVT